MSALLVFGRVALAIGITAGVVAAWLFAPDANNTAAQTQRQPQSVAVGAMTLRLVCPGAAVRIGGEDGTEVGSIERLGAARLFVRNGDPSQPVSSQAEFTEFQLFSSDSPLQQSSDLLSGWQLQELVAPRITGVAATACVSPSREQWFVAGSTRAQDDSVLLVHNPGAVEAAISIRAFGDSTADLDFALAPGATDLISLATLLPRSEELAVHVTSSTPVSSWLQHRTSRGLSATGFDLATGQAAPSDSIAIAGVSVIGSELAPIADLTTPVVRIYNPGVESVEVLAQAVSSGSQFGNAQRVVVPAGSFESVSLGDLDDGEYAIFLDADEPILAGVFNPVALAIDSFDFAWLSAGEVFDVPFAIAGGGPAASLAIANPGSMPVNLTVILGSRQLQLSLAARSQEVVPVPADTEVRVSPKGPVTATLRLTEAGYSVVQPRESLNRASSVSVVIR